MISDISTRSPALLQRETSRMVVVDLQARLVPVIPEPQPFLQNCRLLLQGGRLLGIPISATEQYPQGLGTTVPEIGELLTEPAVAKQAFSGAGCLKWTVREGVPDRTQIVLAGIEAHVCILQTALDLQSLGYDVFVPADAVASRRPRDATEALARLRDQGITVTTIESVLFEWCGTSTAPEFRELSRLIKSRPD